MRASRASAAAAAGPPGVTGPSRMRSSSCCRMLTSEAAMEAAAATLRGAGAVALPALQLVDRLLQNVLGNPDEAKYRRIRLANAKIDGGLRPQPAARRLLELCGFAASADGEHLDMADAAAHDCARLELARAIIRRAREAVEID